MSNPIVPVTDLRSDWRSERSRYAALSRSRAADDSELVEARARMASMKFLNDVERLVSDAPPLSEEQRHQIAAMLLSVSE